MSRTRTFLRRICRQVRRRGTTEADRGSSAVELAILAPAILISLFAGIQVACLFFARSVALTAAQQGTTAERAYNAAPGSGHSRATNFLARSGDWLNQPTVSVVRDGTQVTTVVRGTALSLIPGMTFTVSQTAHGSVERFTTEDQP